MEMRDRQSITHNLVQLVEQTDIDSILPKLREKGVFNEVMLEKYAPNRSTPRVRKEELYLDVQTRGPQAFGKLLESFMETGHFDLVRILKPDIDIQAYLLSQTTVGVDALPSRGERPEGRIVPMSLPDYLLNEDGELQNRIHNLALANANCTINLSTQPLRVVVKQATHRHDRCTKKDLPVYPMGSRPKGFFFMINNVQFVNDIEEERRGAEVDEQNLQVLFRDLGYEVIVERDQGLQDMKRKLEEFSNREEHSRVDSCVVAILTHGRAGHVTEGTNLIASDGGVLPIEWVVDCFSNRNCPRLQAKPKIFIFQTCRGEMLDYGVKVVAGDRTRTDGIATALLRTSSDILIAYSTIPGYKSYRDKYLGTWFIQTICKIFMEHACDTDIVDMLVMVDTKLSSLVSETNTMQTSCFENRAFRKFYFNPGIYDDTNTMTNDHI